jgi:hypothetical protein
MHIVAVKARPSKSRYVKARPSKSRYDVLLNGSLISELYWNKTGYCGKIPLPDGHFLSIGEKNITDCELPLP